MLIPEGHTIVLPPLSFFAIELCIPTSTSARSCQWCEIHATLQIQICSAMQNTPHPKLDLIPRLLNRQIQPRLPRKGKHDDGGAARGRGCGVRTGGGALLARASSLVARSLLCAKGSSCCAVGVVYYRGGGGLLFSLLPSYLLCLLCDAVGN